MARSSSCPTNKCRTLGLDSDGMLAAATHIRRSCSAVKKRPRRSSAGHQAVHLATSRKDVVVVGSDVVRVPKVADAHLFKSSVGCLDENAFKNFAPLLAACQGYAGQSGCRFLGNDFRGVPRKGAVAWQGTASQVVAFAGQANTQEPDISETVFAVAERLRMGERALAEEINRAFHLVMVESVRNAMIATFRKLEMWPPVLKPFGVEDDDCSYEDVSSSLLVIAQRAYNDDLRRRNELVGIGGLCRIRRRAMTASFLIDFAQTFSPVPLPSMPETHVMMLREFACRVAEWDLLQSPPQEAQEVQTTRHARDAFMCGLGAGVVADRVRSESDGLWTPAPSPLLAAGLMLMGPVLTTSLAVIAAALHRSRVVSAPRAGSRSSHVV